MTKCARCGREGADWKVSASGERIEVVCAACLGTQTRPSFLVVQAELEKMIVEAAPPPFRSRVSWLTCLPNADTGADENYAKATVQYIMDGGPWLAAYKHWKAESGPGIAALDLRPPTRQPTRHKTTSWDPDMPLEDAEPGRYGWRS